MKQKATGILIVLLATAVVLELKFHEVIGNLNNYLFNDLVDAFKSYSNFSYYLRYGSGLQHTGINYPYGDHLHFINAHAFYLYVIELFGISALVANEGVGIINGMMLLSILVSVPFIYLILKEFKLPQWYAIILALAIQFGYPQFDRINGHFEFMIAFVIPAFWYFMIQFRKQNHRVRWTLIIITYLSCVALFSAYMAVFCAAFGLSIFIVEFIRHRRDIRSLISKALPIAAVCLLPLMAFLIFISLTDSAVDRPSYPWGFMEFNSNPLSIFLPDTSILKSIFPARMYHAAWEGRAYVGLPATFLALTMIFYLFYQLIAFRRFNLSPFLKNKELNIYLAAASILLLYAMGWPFEWSLEFLVDYIPIIKQFRALGRFSWVFYYVFSVYAAYQIYHFYREIRYEKAMKFGSVVFMLFVIAQWGFDAAINLNKSNFDKIKPNELLYRDDAPFLKPFESDTINVNDFQAILSLPFAQTNGDKMLFHRGQNAIKMGMAYSYHTGLPIIQSFSPRLSFSNSLTSIQLLANDCIAKQRLEDMNEKAILLIVTKDKLRPPETKFISNFTPFHEDGQLRFYQIPISFFKTTYSSCEKQYQTMRDTIQLKSNIYSAWDINKVFYLDFENSKSNGPATFTGQGSFYERRGEHKLFDEELSARSLVGWNELSFWVYVDTRKYGVPEPFLDEYDEKGDLVKSTYIGIRETHDVDDFWIRCSRTFPIVKPHRYVLRVRGEYITVDDVLIRSITDNVIVRQSEADLFNNYRFEH